jgi:metal-responsive CopG/Arc/MetJ family transcriptional regulator
MNKNIVTQTIRLPVDLAYVLDEVVDEQGLRSRHQLMIRTLKEAHMPEDMEDPYEIVGFVEVAVKGKKVTCSCGATDAEYIGFRRGFGALQVFGPLCSRCMQKEASKEE